MFKGFVIDSDRFKQGSKFDRRFFDELLEEIRKIRASERMAYQKITDIYTTAIDYSPKSDIATKFFAIVPNKLHFAITGNTEVEIIAGRAQQVIAKNYLSKEEISEQTLVFSKISNKKHRTGSSLWSFSLRF